MPSTTWSSATNNQSNQSNQANELLLTHTAKVAYEGLYLPQVSPQGNLSGMGKLAPVLPNFATQGYTQSLANNTELCVIINTGTDVTAIDRIMIPVSVLGGAGQDVMVSLQTTFTLNGIIQPTGNLIVGELITVPHEFQQSTDALDPTQVSDSPGVQNFPGLNIGMVSAAPTGAQYGATIASPSSLTLPFPGNVTSGAAFASDGNSIVMLGGQASGVSVANVWTAPLAGFPTGVGPWAAQPSLPVALTFPTVITVNGFLVVVGGSNVSNALVASVYTASLSTTGLVGNWAQQSNYGTGVAASPTPSSEGIPLYNMGLVAVPANLNGSGNLATVFGFGGKDNVDARPMNQIFSATIDVNGNMSTWKLAGTFARPIWEPTFVLVNGWVVSVGGLAQSVGDQDHLEQRTWGAKVNLQSGQKATLGPWVPFPDLPYASIVSSTSTTFTGTSATDATLSLGANFYTGMKVYDTVTAPATGGGDGGTPGGNFATIVTNTSTALTTTAWQPFTPPNGRVFRIQSGITNPSLTVVGNAIYCIAGSADTAGATTAYQGYSLTVGTGGPSSTGWTCLNIPGVAYPNSNTQGAPGPGPSIIFPGIGTSTTTTAGTILNVGNVPYVSIPITVSGLSASTNYAIVIQGFPQNDLLNSSQVHLCGNANLPTNGTAALGGILRMRTAAATGWSQAGQYASAGVNAQHAIAAGALQINFDSIGPVGYTNGQTIYLGVLGASTTGELLEAVTLVSGAGTGTWTISPPTKNAYAANVAWITNAPFHPNTSIPLRCYVGHNGRPLHVAEDNGFRWAWLIPRSYTDGRLQGVGEFIAPAVAFTSSVSTTYTNTGGTDTAANWVTNQWVGAYVVATNSVGFITANTATTFTVRGWQGSVIAAGSTFSIFATGGSRSMRVMDTTSETFTGSAGSGVTTDYNGSMQGWGNTAWSISGSTGGALTWGE